MAPFPHKSEDGVDEVMELQNTAHYSPNIISGIQPVSILDSINSVLHVTKSSNNNGSGSQPGSSSGFLSPTSSGQGEQEEESDTVVLLSLFVPLAATVAAIFVIALFVRRMRRAGSMNEVQDRPSSSISNNENNKDEFQMQVLPRKKISAHSTSSTSSASSSSSTTNSLQHNNHNHRSLTSSKSSSRVYGNSMKHMNSFNSSGGGSIYRNSSYLHLQLQHQSSLPASLGSVSSTPTGVAPPWPLAAESGLYYTRSHYGLNKLHQQLYQQASLQAYSSVQNLSGLVFSRQYSETQSLETQSDPEIDVSSSGDDSSNTDSSKKSTHKKFKSVLNAMNFPRKIRQYQADRKRFNIYTIPVETREQLKHIYVY